MKRVTIYDVAKEAGVSLATVSRVINRSDVVKAPTKDKVEAAIERLGYKPNAIAQGLALSKTTTIGLVIPEASYTYIGQIIKGIIDDDSLDDALGETEHLLFTVGIVDRTVGYLEVIDVSSGTGRPVRPTAELQDVTVAESQSVDISGSSTARHNFTGSRTAAGKRKVFENQAERVCHTCVDSDLHFETRHLARFIFLSDDIQRAGQRAISSIHVETTHIGGNENGILLPGIFTEGIPSRNKIGFVFGNIGFNKSN